MMWKFFAIFFCFAGVLSFMNSGISSFLKMHYKNTLEILYEDISIASFCYNENDQSVEPRVFLSYSKQW